MSQLARPLRQAAAAARLSRHLSTTVPAAAAASDPIQKLFLDKLREYGSKAKYVATKWKTASGDLCVFLYPDPRSKTTLVCAENSVNSYGVECYRGRGCQVCSTAERRAWFSIV